MGLFSFFKKKDNQEIINKMTAFSTQALGAAISGIEENETFLPFGAVLTEDKTLHLVVYHDPSAESIDPREHAMNVQKIIAKRYEEPDCELCHMAFDGISHLPSGDIDSINVRVSHKPTNTHKLFSYTYKVVDGKVEIQNRDHPITVSYTHLTLPTICSV